MITPYYHVQGTIIEVGRREGGVAKVSRKEWAKQIYVLRLVDDGDHPQHIAFALWGRDIDFYGLREGDIVSVELKIESRPFDGKWYTEATAARVSITERLPSASELAGQM